MNWTGGTMSGSGRILIVTGAGVGAEEPFHAGDKIGLGRFGHEIKVITHETPSMELPTGFLAGLT